MMRFRIRMTFSRRKIDEAAVVLRSLVGPIRAENGCAVTRLLRDLDEEQTLTFIEEWRDVKSIHHHLRGMNFRTLLEVIEMAERAPTIEIDQVASRRGFDVVEEVLGIGRSGTSEIEPN